MQRIPYYLIILTDLFLPLLVIAQQTNVSVSIGASLTATEDINPWLSPSGDFAFGFQQVQGSENFLLSIWYDKIPEKTIIWYPEGGPIVPRGSKIELKDGRGLVLSDPQGKDVWTSGSTSDIAYGVMNDTGNFVIVGNDQSRKIWDSFNFPADTMLPTQILERGGVIYSRMSRSNVSRGRFQLRFLQDGNLVLNTRDVASDFAYAAYYATETDDPSNQSNSGDQLIFDAVGYLYVLRRNGKRFDLTPRLELPFGDYYHRVTLDFDGVFTQYYHSKDSTDNSSWERVWSYPENICLSFLSSEGSGACGFNNVCSLDENNRPKCECPRGFSLLDPNDPYGDCKPYFFPNCEKGDSNKDDFEFVELKDIDWPTSDYVIMNPTSELECKNSCLDDCFCGVAIYRGNKCWKKKLPLSNGKVDVSLNVKAFVKSRKGDLPIESPPHFSKKKNDRQSLIIVGSALLGTSVFVNILLFLVICLGIFLIYKKETRKLNPGPETHLIRFKYQQLVHATNGFKDELGKGAFGIVYKGVMGTNTVAVKKLNTMAQDGEKDFRTEVNAIARTHHRNLVQLLGFCDDGEQRLLVYEYMSNGTLASFLFGNMRPSWNHRCHIALGIAKGLSYLHEECSNQIIHCDIKPQNILLDEYYNARISDFGLAKLLVMNQSRTVTGIRGTKGYVAPEWFRNTPVTIKVDVYSFGVLLLEIISCRKSVKDNIESGNEYEAILTDWAWDCYQEGRLDLLVENDLEALDDFKKLKTFVMVGLWCVQENPLLRPTMRNVIQMLEGVVEVTEPSCPFPSSLTLG